VTSHTNATADEKTNKTQRLIETSDVTHKRNS
jgi:hypothetical protein